MVETMSEASSSLMGLYKGTRLKKEKQFFDINLPVQTLSSEKKSNDPQLLFEIFRFKNEINKAENVSEIIEKLISVSKLIAAAEEAALFLFEEETGKLKPVESVVNNSLVDMLNKYYKEGILNFVFESDRPTLVPELQSYNSNSTQMNFILIPVIEDENKKGLFVVLTSLDKNSLTEIQKETINFLLNLALSEIEKKQLKAELYSAIEDVQVYKAKLSNDFRLMEIGKLTEGIVEDIVTPLQVILSQTEMLKEREENSEEINKIKKQVEKINGVISRLVKFSETNKRDLKISPYKINSVLTEYYNLVKSTLDSLNLECVLDLGKNIPTMITHPHYIYQLLTNLIGLVDHKPGKKSGVILQTRYSGGMISLNLITTQALKLEDKRNSFELNMKIINNIVSKHMGIIVTNSHKDRGCSISIKFPVKQSLGKI